MPCYEVRVLSVEFTGKSLELLEKIGARVNQDKKSATWNGLKIDLIGGKVTGSDQGLINQLKQEYSKAAVLKYAGKRGWQMQTIKGKKREYQLVKY